MKKKALYKKLGVKEGHKPGALLESLQAKGGAKALLKKHKHYKKHEKCAMCEKAHSKHEKKSEKHEKKHGKNWIAGAIKKPGALHRELGVKAGNKIPAGKLAHAAKKGGKEGKRARLAETLKSFHKAKGKHKKGYTGFDASNGSSQFGRTKGALSNFGRASMGSNGPVGGNSNSTSPTAKPMPKKHGKKKKEGKKKR